MLHYFLALAPGIVWTIVVTGLSLVVGIVLGLPIALMRRSPIAALRFIGRFLIELFRGIPSIVLLFIVFYGIGSGRIQVSPLAAAVVTLGLVCSAYMAEVYRSAFGSITFGQWEASEVIGLTKWDTLWHVILPQAVRVAIPSMATIAIGTLKDSAVASTVGVIDVTALAVIQTNQTLEGIKIYTIAALIYIALSAPFAVSSRWLHAKLSKRVSR
jgi:polar amino acid transport system permease protein